MPDVSARHPSYQASLPMWRKCRDCVEGEEAVKAGSILYLPMLGGQDELEYLAYRHRAQFYGASSRTVAGLAGAVMRNPPHFEFPDEKILEDVGVSGESAEMVLKEALNELLTTGRVVLCVDADQGDDDTPADPEAEPYICVYYAENMINWEERTLAGRKTLVMAVFEEKASELSEDGFTWEEVTHWREMRLEDSDTSSPKLAVRVWERDDDAVQRNAANTGTTGYSPDDEFVMISEVHPTFRGGKNVPYLPVQVLNKSKVGAAVDKSPILPLVDVNLGHYRNSADLEHGLHFTALPTAYATGVESGSKLRIGSSRAWILPNPQSKVGFLEFTGAGLGLIRTEMQAKEVKMAVLGSRMLEEQKNDPEATQTVQLRQSGEQSVLTGIATTLEEGFTFAFTWLAEWRGDAGAKVTVEVNKDFMPIGLDSFTLTALMQSVQQGQMSWPTYFYNVKRAGFTPPDRTMEEEQQLIQQGAPQTPQQAAAAQQAAQGQQGADQGSPAGGGGPPSSQELSPLPDIAPSELAMRTMA